MFVVHKIYYEDQEQTKTWGKLTTNEIVHDVQVDKSKLSSVTIRVDSRNRTMAGGRSRIASQM